MSSHECVVVYRTFRQAKIFFFQIFFYFIFSSSMLNKEGFQILSGLASHSLPKKLYSRSLGLVTYYTQPAGGNRAPAKPENQIQIKLSHIFILSLQTRRK